MYFKSVELTGTLEGTTKQPKMSLLNEIIPALEREVEQKYNENGQVKIVIVKQEDGAGLHTNLTYQKKRK